MRHGSLFSGIGGFDLAAEWMGWENVFHCEWNEFGQKVLKHYWPKSISYGDITKTDFTVHRGAIDIITGGFPCQPFSMAGKRKGTDDDRHLWPEMLRCIREVSPKYIVGENVGGIINWDGGLVFHQVQIDLEAEGYEVQPFVLPACAVNAPHRRDRVWFVAHSKNSNANRLRGNGNCGEQFSKGKRKEVWSEFGSISIKEFTPNSPNSGFESLRSEREDTVYGFGNVADTRGIGLSCKGKSAGVGRYRSGKHIAQTNKSTWDYFPTQPPVRNGNDGFPSRLDSITFPKWRNESIKAGGNAIVPQVVYQIFKAIRTHEEMQTQTTLFP